MQELNTRAFLAAATALARTHQIFKGLTGSYHEVLIDMSIELILSGLSVFRDEADKVGAKLAVLAADRLIEQLKADPCTVTVAQATIQLSEIESRFADHLIEVRLFALHQHEAVFLEAADDLIEIEGFSAAYPKTSFEIEEAAKCLAYGRHTAAVFHAMRMLELGIKALSKRLIIEDPTKTSEKNWGIILGKISARIDELYPKNKRLPDTEGAAFEALYATLDSVRNPWRNSTMHVETIYMPHEALHILRCCAFFMSRLHTLCDEEGTPRQEALLPIIEASEATGTGALALE
jgi:hypothetical protein